MPRSPTRAVSFAPTAQIRTIPADTETLMRSARSRWAGFTAPPKRAKRAPSRTKRAGQLKGAAARDGLAGAPPPQNLLRATTLLLLAAPLTAGSVVYTHSDGRIYDVANCNPLSGTAE